MLHGPEPRPDSGLEQDFKCFSDGLRLGRSAHQALACIRSQCTHQGIQWILEVDIRKYFDTLKQEWLRKFLDRRVSDGVIRRLIGKWLQAGVWEKGQLSYPEVGVISPLLSNIYLHEVLDCRLSFTFPKPGWFTRSTRRNHDPKNRMPESC